MSKPDKLSLEEVECLADKLRISGASVFTGVNGVIFYPLQIMRQLLDMMRENEQLHMIINSIPEFLQRYKESGNG
jgi:hypothetical protein